MKELLEWVIAKEAEAHNHLLLCEAMGDQSDADYAQGLYESYGVVVAKIEQALNA